MLMRCLQVLSELDAEFRENHIEILKRYVLESRLDRSPR